MHAAGIRHQASLWTPTSHTWVAECLGIAQDTSHRVQYAGGSPRILESPIPPVHTTGSACGDCELRYNVWNLDL